MVFNGSENDDPTRLSNIAPGEEELDAVNMQ
jgi:hypothetical protein